MIKHLTIFLNDNINNDKHKNKENRPSIHSRKLDWSDYTFKYNTKHSNDKNNA